MCNSLHPDSKPLRRKNGIGYKLFDSEGGPLTTKVTYKTDPDGFTRWTQDERLDTKFGRKYLWPKSGDGFCFFLSKREAIRAAKYWVSGDFFDTRVDVMKIEYENGLGSHIEKAFIENPIRIALCTGFKKL